MLDGKLNNDPITIRSTASLRQAAETMDKRHVGSLVVVDAWGKVIGIVTDRDLCLRAVALDRDPDSTTVERCMTAEARTLPIDTDLTDQVQAMRSLGVRRMPLVDGEGVPHGIAAIDDILLWAAARLSELAGTAVIGRRHVGLREPLGLLRELEAHVESRASDAAGAGLGERRALPLNSLQESIQRLREGLLGDGRTEAP